MIATTYKSDVEQYIDGILSGDIPSNELVRLCVERHLHDLEHGPERGLIFDEKIAQTSIMFFEGCLRHTIGEWDGKPFVLTPPQKFIAWCVYGWRVAATGFRRFSRATVCVARKFGKSEFAAGCALQHASFDNPLEPGAEVNLAATAERQVRDTTYQTCCRMVEKSPALASRMKVQQASIAIAASDRFQPNSVIRPRGSDGKSSDGYNLSAAILDEMHAWQKHHHEFYQKMTTAGGSRRQELVWIFTTEGDDGSELWISVQSLGEKAVRSFKTGEERAYDHIFHFQAGIDDGDDPFEHDVDSPEVEVMIRKSNPNYPITPKPDYIKRQILDGHGDPLQKAKVLRFHFNKRVSINTKPFDPVTWLERAEELEFPTDGTPLYGGFDLGRSNDFAAWTLVWLGEDGAIHFKSRSYTAAEDRDLAVPSVQTYIDRGLLYEHPGNQVDFNLIQWDLIQLGKEYNVIHWCYDPQFATHMAQNLQAELGEDQPLKFTQSALYYNEPCRDLQRQYKAGKVVPDLDPCLAWQMGNLTYKSNGRDEYMPDKRLSKDHKIDAAVSALMAYRELIMGADDGPAESWYDDHDVELV